MQPLTAFAGLVSSTRTFASSTTRYFRLSSTLIGLGMLLVPMPALAYRTIADLPDFAGAQRVRWRDGVYAFDIHAAVPDALPLPSFASTAQRALEAWSEPSCSGVRILFLGATDSPAEAGDGRNTIEVIEEGWEELGYDRQALGATALEFEETDDGWEIVEADVHLNAEHHSWTLSDVPTDASRSVLGTLRHEGGHALGLLHPCEANGEDGAPPCDESFTHASLMYPFYEAAQIELTPDDEAGICMLYPSCEVEGCDAGLVCSAGVCLPECGGGVCERDEICLDGACISQEECARTSCVAMTPAWVVGCAPSDECPSGLCLSDGSCAEQCAGDDDCSDRRPCVFDEDPSVPGYCGLVPLRKLGEECASPLECEDGECLDGAKPRPLCTRRCSSADPVCPSGWSCSSVEGRPVCVPARTPRGCGLAPRGQPEEPELSWVPALMLSFLFSAQRRRRKRVGWPARSPFSS